VTTPNTARPDTRHLLVFPYNGNGLEALDCAGHGYAVRAFVDDTPQKIGHTPYGFPVLTRNAFSDFPDDAVLAVPGGPKSFRERSAVIASLNVDPERYARVVHGSARVSRFAVVGRNVLLMGGVVITSNAVIGDHVCILPNSVVHHDAAVGNYALIGSNVTVAGGARIGANAYLGSGASVMNGVTIGDRALVGLGSVVIRDVPPGATVAGSPARQL
jgi:sugar O-acyltransferase (sialic acid O-acetyltransferase NeuD family)